MRIDHDAPQNSSLINFKPVPSIQAREVVLASSRLNSALEDTVADLGSMRDNTAYQSAHLNINNVLVP